MGHICELVSRHGMGGSVWSLVGKMADGEAV